MRSIKISFRNLWKYKYTSLVNLLGLTISLFSSVFIFMWVYDEVTFDKFQKNYKNIYLVASEWKYADGKSDFIMETPTPLSPFLKDNFSEVAQSTRFAKQFGGRYLKWGDKEFLEQGLAVEPSFFDIFTVDFVQGDAGSIRDKPNSIVISQRLASKFFGNQDPVNQTITFVVNNENTKPYQVSGVYRNIPDNSSLQFDFLIPLSVSPTDNWFSFGVSTFILLPNKIERSKLNEKIAQFYKGDKLNFKIDWYLHPLEEMHFHSDFQLFVYHPGDVQYVYIFAIAGIFILLIAIMNFVSLMGVLFSNRIKEAGVRKIIGATKIRLAFTFLAESLILVFCSLFLTLILIETFQPAFNSFSGSNIPAIHDNYFILVFLILLILFIGIISGILPGIFIAGVKPVDAINQRRISNKASFRKYLIALQFTLSIILLSSTLLINKQLNYIFQKDLGFRQENIVHIQLKGNVDQKYAAAKQEILSNPMVEAISNNSPLLGSGIEIPGWSWAGSKPGEKHSIAQIQADDDFLKTFGIKLVQGNYFSEGSSSVNQVVINEEAAKIMNMTEPIGQHLQLKGKDYEIIGVTNNFHSRHFAHSIRPLLILYKGSGRSLYVKYDSAADKTSVLNSIKKVYEKFNPDFPFEYQFFSDEFISIYRNERRMLTLLSYFVIVAFLILCSGLYALSKQIVLSKTKEIGIRKVNGARIREVMTMLNLDFVKWVAIAFVVATPISYFVMSKWLESFAYKTELSWWLFALAGLIALGIALLTVSWQSWKAATKNPVEALRYE